MLGSTSITVTGEVVVVEVVVELEVVEVEVDVVLDEVIALSSTEVASELLLQKETSKRSIKYLFMLK
tara:strand:+ start:1113 stop:1313 length:201 start_codon:yes stop_codon:yes gene_type:complete